MFDRPAPKIQTTEAVGRYVRITNPFSRAVEDHIFDDADEATKMARIISEALSWVGTPFRDCADVKGPNGGVDCAMLLVRSYVDTGALSAFDPRPYPPQWHMNHDEERFLGWIEGNNPATGKPWWPERAGESLYAKRVERPRVGDCVVYQYGRCYSHGAIIINSREIVHAYAKSDVCHVSLQAETDLLYLRNGRPRPRLYFEVRR